MCARNHAATRTAVCEKPQHTHVCCIMRGVLPPVFEFRTDAMGVVVMVHVVAEIRTALPLHVRGCLPFLCQLACYHAPRTASIKTKIGVQSRQKTGVCASVLYIPPCSHGGAFNTCVACAFHHVPRYCRTISKIEKFEAKPNENRRRHTHNAVCFMSDTITKTGCSMGTGAASIANRMCPITTTPAVLP